MRNRIANALSILTIMGGVLCLSHPVTASAAVPCSELQWDYAQSIVNSLCEGASFTVACPEPDQIVVNIVYCPVS